MGFERLLTGLRLPRMRISAFVCALIVLASCSAKDRNGLTNSDLYELSQEQHKVVLQAYGGIYLNKQIVDYVDQIVNRMSRVSRNKEIIRPVIILDSPEVNAFSLPNGNVYITRGLIALANDEAELASVIAHEIAHIDLNHAKKRIDLLDQAQATVQKIDILTGDESAAVAASIDSQATLASFSRRQEEEADAVGIRRLKLAGYDLGGAVRFLNSLDRHQRFQDKWLGSGSSEADFLSTHPRTPERIRKAKQLVKSQIGSTRKRVAREAYLSAINGLLYEENPKNGLIRRNVFSHPYRKITFTAPLGYKMVSTANFIQGLHKRGSAFRYDVLKRSLFDDDHSLLLRDSNIDADLVRVQRTNINSFVGVTAEASTDEWSYFFAFLEYNDEIHRFAFASEGSKSQIIADGEKILRSFRELTNEELRTLKPRRVRIAKAMPGDDKFRFAQLMKVDYDKLETFLVLNNLSGRQRIKAGRLYKIISTADGK